MIENIPLAAIDPNPYQTRQNEDQEHIKNLALSIAAKGLLQIPTGRRTDGSIQLAFGHSRLAAFKWLEEVKANSNLNGDWSTIPINIQELTDPEMFELAVVENLERRNLSPIDEAKAMSIYRDQFGKTSAEIGELFHLSDSAVRNKIRLLGLPADAQEALRIGAMTEGSARSLLPLLDLPEDLWKHWQEEESRNSYPKKNPVVDAALAGEIGSEEVRRRVTGLFESYSCNLAEAWWKYDDELKDNEVRSLKCRDCSLRQDAKCFDRACFALKKKIYKSNYLYLASKAAGIPKLEPEKWMSYYLTYLVERHYGRDDSQATKKEKALLSSGCQNLRVAFDEQKEPTKDLAHSITGYPRALIVCKNRYGTCRCMTGYEVMAKEQIKKEDENSSSSTIESKPQSEILRQAAADDLKRKHSDAEIIIKLEKLAAGLLASKALQFDIDALIYLFKGSNYLYESRKKDWSTVINEESQKVFAANFYNEMATLADWLKRYNQILADCGLPQLKPEDASSTIEEILSKSQVQEVSIPTL